MASELTVLPVKLSVLPVLVLTSRTMTLLGMLTLALPMAAVSNTDGSTPPVQLAVLVHNPSPALPVQLTVAPWLEGVRLTSLPTVPLSL